MKARVLIVDDEPIARRGLRRLLEMRDDIIIVGECANGNEAVEQIRNQRIDLVLLDMQMPGLDGLGVIRAIGVQEMPCVVFVTAFDEHAIEAFVVAATDYIVKPYTPERLTDAVHRALRRIREHRVVSAHEQLLRALGDTPERQGNAPLSDAPAFATRILVSIGTRSIVVPIADVNVVEADGYYVRVRTVAAQYVVRESLKHLEARLDPRDFSRVHRSALVRISCVCSLERVSHERIVLVLIDGSRVPVSRARRDAVVEALGEIRG